MPRDLPARGHGDTSDHTPGAQATWCLRNMVSMVVPRPGTTKTSRCDFCRLWRPEARPTTQGSDQRRGTRLPHTQPHPDTLAGRPLRLPAFMKGSSILSQEGRGAVVEGSLALGKGQPDAHRAEGLLGRLRPPAGQESPGERSCLQSRRAWPQGSAWQSRPRPPQRCPRRSLLLHEIPFSWFFLSLR